LEDFLRNNYSLLTRSVEIIAAVVGLLCLKKYKSTHTKYFIYYLVYVALLELIGSYPRYVANYDSLLVVKNYLKGGYFEKNYWWYSIFWNVGGIVFLSFYFRKILSNRIFKTILKYSTLLFMVFAMLYYAINFKELFFNSIFTGISLFGIIIILGCFIFYFFEVLNSEKILEFHKSINFYISATIFFWWLIITPLIFYEIYFSSVDWSFIFLKWQIFLFANVFMYLTFTFALIYCKPELKND